MSAAVLAGAAVGAGVLALLRALIPLRPSLSWQLARLDAGPRPAPTQRLSLDALSATSRVRHRVGERLEVLVADRGWRLPRVRADLAVLDRPLGEFLATSLLSAAVLLLVAPMSWVTLRLMGILVPLQVPALPALVLAGVAGLAPVLAARTAAARRRREFRRVVGVFSDLVAMNLAGGRGLPEALLASATISEHWALQRIRRALSEARLLGASPWQALGDLGRDLAIDELRDLAGALTLAADDGATIRASLSARAATLRRKEMADAEGEAGEKDQSMLVAQLLLCTAFLVFLAYPALAGLLAQS